MSYAAIPFRAICVGLSLGLTHALQTLLLPDRFNLFPFSSMQHNTLQVPEPFLTNSHATMAVVLQPSKACLQLLPCIGYTAA